MIDIESSTIVGGLLIILVHISVSWTVLLRIHKDFKAFVMFYNTSFLCKNCCLHYSYTLLFTISRNYSASCMKAFLI